MKDAPAPRPNKRPRLGPSPDEAEAATKTAKGSKFSKDKAKKDKHVELVDEFMQVMQPRTRGPSWKDTDPVALPTASTSTNVIINSVKKDKKLKKAITSTNDLDEQPDEPELSGGPMSDMDWLKRHTKSTLDADDALQKVFEQSDDEHMEDDEEDDDKDSEVCAIPLIFPFVYLR